MYSFVHSFVRFGLKNIEVFLCLSFSHSFLFHTLVYMHNHQTMRNGFVSFRSLLQQWMNRLMELTVEIARRKRQYCFLCALCHLHYCDISRYDCTCVCVCFFSNLTIRWNWCHKKNSLPFDVRWSWDGGIVFAFILFAWDFKSNRKITNEVPKIIFNKSNQFRLVRVFVLFVVTEQINWFHLLREINFQIESFDLVSDMIYWFWFECMKMLRALLTTCNNR